MLYSGLKVDEDMDYGDDAITILLNDFVRSLVSEPDEVDIEVVETSNTVVYTIEVLPDDVGKVIGKGGSIINALKVLFYALGCKNGKKIHIELET